MSDLVNRLREPIKPEYEEKLNHTARRYNIQRREAADRIEELERELASARGLERDTYETGKQLFNDMAKQLAAEKALADRLDTALLHARDIIGEASKQLKGKHGSHTWGGWYLEVVDDARSAYRKARGL